MGKAIVATIGSMGIIGVLLLVFAPLVISLYGLYLAFSASIILGVIVLLVEPSPLILGLVALFGHADIAQRIANWLGL